MLANFFNKSTPFHTLVIVLFVLLIMLIVAFQADILSFNPSFLLKEIAIFLLLIGSFFMVHFINFKNKLVKENAYDLLIFLILIALFHNITLHINLILTHLILLFAFRRIYSLRSPKNVREKIFESGLYIGLATIFYPFSMLYLILCIAAVLIFERRTIRNIFIPIVGFMVPLFLYGTYLFLTDQFSPDFIVFNTNFSYSAYNNFTILIPITLLITLLLWTIFSSTVKVLAVNNEFKSFWILVLVHLALSIFISIPAPVKDGSEFIFLFFPSLVLFTNYLQMATDHWFKEVFIYLMVAGAIAVFLV
ncbi:MAG: hypothetical protein CR989_04060 [Flavobacteriales bacterium]|nr:MAG: hypothetical protein CR989_04060 [Flavobacteriales bacterium]